MDRGKRICNILKELRKRIADANGIRYEIEECPHTGPCPGTCPKCEQELEDLLDKLHWLEQDGGKLKLRDLMTEEELRMFLSNSPSQVQDREDEPLQLAGIPVLPEEDEHVHRLQGKVCRPTEDIMGDMPNQGNIPFTMTVIQKLLELNDGTNLIFSPIGLQTALEMLQQGMSADSPVCDAVQDLMQYADSFIPECNTKEFTLEKATSIWMDKAKGEVKETYIENIETEFDAAVFNKDFKESEAVKNEIDEWVSDKTHQAIKSLDLQLSRDAFMVLLNAIYMKAKWEYPFDESATDDEPFRNADGSTVKVRMMHNTFSDVAYTDTIEYKSISLPYADGKHSMVIVLPHIGHDLDDVIASEDWMYPSETDGQVEFSMPKFDFDAKVDMVEVLKELGLEDMFDRGDSFPMISDQPINVSQFFQQCTVAVDEDGTEAAAVTVVECEVGCLPPDEPIKTYRMCVNRPFGFAVKYDDGINDKVIFVGVVKELDDIDGNTPKKAASKRGQISSLNLPSESRLGEAKAAGNKRLSSITVAGTTHIKNIDELSDSIDIGTELRLEHDKENKYDKYAVALYLGDERVGFVPRGENEIIANLLDAGTPLVAIVTYVEWRGSWLCINADIELVVPKQNDLVFTVEPATKDDAESIAQFQIDMALESEGTVLDKEIVLKGVSEGLSDPNKGLYFVARSEKGEAIASLMITKEWSDWHCEWYWWIQSVYVKPEYRRQGVYTKMYEKVKALAKEAQVASLRLYVDKTNARGIAAYTALGMKKSHYLLYEDKLK